VQRTPPNRTPPASSYGPLCAAFYDADKPNASDEEIAWYDARLPRDAGPVLDVMCGSGRLLAPLVERGHNLHGVDASAAMLARCEQRLDAAGCRAMLFRQDVATLNLPFRYAAAFVAAGSFQLLVDPQAAKRALERVRAHLVPPGRLLMQCFVPAEATHPPGGLVVEVRTVTLAGGGRITLRSEIDVDAEGRRMAWRNRYERREGATIVAREDERLAVTWYDADAISALLLAAGFVDIEIGPAPGAEVVDAEAWTVAARVPPPTG
jgi:SAM-dependent methyltransferase